MTRTMEMESTLLGKTWKGGADDVTGCLRRRILARAAFSGGGRVRGGEQSAMR